MATILGATVLPAQSVQGGIGASITILQPVGSAVVQASPFSVSRAGVVSMETTSPVTGSTSQLVMVDVTDDDAVSLSASRVTMRTGAMVRALTAGRAMPVGVNGLAPATARSGDFRVSYAVNVGTTPAAGTAVHLTVRYLAVAGT